MNIEKYEGNWPVNCAGCGQGLYGLSWFVLAWVRNPYTTKLEPFCPRCTKVYSERLLRGPWKRFSGRTLELIDKQ